VKITKRAAARAGPGYRIRAAAGGSARGRAAAPITPCVPISGHHRQIGIGRFHRKIIYKRRKVFQLVIFGISIEIDLILPTARCPDPRPVGSEVPQVDSHAAVLYDELRSQVESTYGEMVQFSNAD
jgi:hypothetical protein